jgi:hypothetical protein
VESRDKRINMGYDLGCKGCLNSIDLICSYDMYDSSLCPCQVCLVKGMCRNACNEYNQFRIEQFKKEDG